MTLRKTKAYPQLLLCILIILLSAASSFSAPTPTDALKSTIDKVLVILKDETKSPQERKAVVVETVRERFDFKSMSQFVLSKNWREANDAQRSLFIDKFGKILENTYAGRLQEYSGETVKYLDEKIRGDKALVDTAVATAGNDIPISYKLRSEGDDWFIYDVVIEGISLARNYNATYNEVIHKEGFDGLLKLMDERIQNGDLKE